MQDKVAEVESQVKDLLSKKGKTLSEAKIAGLAKILLESESQDELAVKLKANFSSVLLKAIQGDLEALYSSLQPPDEEPAVDLKLYLEEQGIEPDELEEFLDILGQALQSKDFDQFEASLEYVAPKEAELLRRDFGHMFGLTGEPESTEIKSAPEVELHTPQPSEVTVEPTKPLTVPSAEVHPEILEASDGVLGEVMESGNRSKKTAAFIEKCPEPVPPTASEGEPKHSPSKKDDQDSLVDLDNILDHLDITEVYHDPRSEPRTMPDPELDLTPPPPVPETKKHTAKIEEKAPVPIPISAPKPDPKKAVSLKPDPKSGAATSKVSETLKPVAKPEAAPAVLKPEPKPAPTKPEPKTAVAKSEPKPFSKTKAADGPLTVEAAAAHAQVWCIIKSFLDTGDGYEIQKSKLYEPELLELISKSTPNLQACGFYGDMPECTKKASEFIGKSIPVSEFDTVDKNTIVLKAVMNGSKLALILQSHPSLFSKAFNRKSPLVEFLRYVMDICNCVLMCIPKGLKIEKGESWLKVTQDSTCTLQATEIKENCALNLTKFEPGLKDKRYLNYALIQSDCPKLYAANTVTKSVVTPILWTSTNGYRYTFEQRLSHLESNLPNEYKNRNFDDFEHLIRVINGYMYPFWNESITASIKTELKREFNALQIEFDRRDCINLSTTLANCDVSVIDSSGHYGSRTRVVETSELSIWEKTKNFVTGSKPKSEKTGIKVTGYRPRMPWQFLYDLLKARCLKTTETFLTSLEITFAKFYITKDFDGSVQKTAIEEDILKLSKELNSKAAMQVVDLTPVSEDCGFFLLKNYPMDKSTFFSYTKTTGSQAVNSLQEYPSPDYRMVINSNVLMYFIYDNKNLRANLGRINKAFKFQEGKNIEIFDRAKDTLHSIKSATILSCNENVLILDNDGVLFSYTHSSDKLAKIIRLDSKHNPVPVKPEDASFSYTEVQSSSSGKLIFLLWKRGVDVYDGNYTMVTKIPLDSSFIAFKPLLDPRHGLDFVLLQMRDRFEAFLITGIESSLSLDFSRKTNDEKATSGVCNPVIDYLYLSVDKFGPPMPEINCPDRTLWSYLADIPTEDVEAYMEHLEIPNVKLQESFSFSKVRTITSSDLKFLLLSRIPIHIASIQNYTLVPLSDGEYQSDKFFQLLQQKEDGKSQINKVCEHIRFGHFEEHLKDWKGSISVVSMVGKQSSGKSYMLNRLFGTRFNVAGTRCTDGIWMSMSFLKNGAGEKMLVVVLDCEGLFSIVRSATEETKLCLVLAAVSDVLIINQDLSYNRNLNELMNNLKESCSKLSGGQLFKGCMAFFVRDVVEKSFTDAQQEFESNMKTLCSVPDNFVTKIFQGRVINCLFPYFELKTFDGFIKKAKSTCADQLSKTINRWASGEDFLFSLKIVLSQLMIDDDISLDEHKAKIRSEKFYDQVIEIFHSGLKHKPFEDFIEFAITREESVAEDKDSKSTEDKQSDDSADKLEEVSNSFSDESEEQSESSQFEPEVKIQFKHAEIQIEQEQKELVGDIDNMAPSHPVEHVDDAEDNKPDYIIQFPYQALLSLIINSIGRYKIKHHDRWIQEANQVLVKFFDSRIEQVLKLFDELFKDEAPEFKDNRKRDLQMYLSKHEKRVKLCEKKCRSCKRNCFELEGHANDCFCHTDHLCIGMCHMKDECKEKKNPCVRIFGHEGAHACADKHKCPEMCTVEGCAYYCQRDPGHPETDHDCRNKHPCAEKCSQVNCTRSCGQDKSVEHKSHECGESKCVVKCQFCDQGCMEENHFHQESIDGKKDFKLDHHNCGKKDHKCPKKCESNGTCNFRYEPQDKEITNGDGKITYTYMKPVKVVEDCSKTIPKSCSKHDEACKCTAEVHRCDKKCPECGSFCMEKYGHPGNHSTANHRNKEFCKFVAVSKSSKITLISEGTKRVYNPGETCEPEICSESCKRKFRSHFHLKECPGPDKCPQKTNPRVIHSTEKYHPFETKIFDKWLCTDYWQSFDWAPPVSAEVAAVNALCNAYCLGCHTNKLEVPPKFCELPALHSGPHKITCDHSASVGKYQVAFLIDSTGSMGSYLEKSKTTIRNIVKKFKEVSSKAVVEFGFVDYKDHPPEDTTYVTNIKGFCTEAEILKHIEGLNASGGGDYPEAVLDGLDDAACKLSWKSDYNKFLFHIGDAPPHGTLYTNGGDSFASGCPCGKKIENIAKTINDKAIRYNLFKIGSGMNKMDDIFKFHIKQHQSSSIDSPATLDLEITAMLVGDLQSAELDAVG